MKTGIILGNGINNRIGITSFSLESIRDRFIENIHRYMSLFEASFDMDVDENEIVGKLKASENFGIETLAGIVYKYVSEILSNRWTENDDIRIQDLLTCIAITTIFLDKTGKRKVTYYEELLPDFAVYDSIYTLNYFEFWDKKQVTKPLHGHVDLSKIYEDTNMLVSIPRMGYEKYKRAVEDLSKCNRVQMVDLGEVVFAPSTVDKDHLICVQGLYPSDRLYPAEDLYPLEEKMLYEELNEVDEIDVFGMSPYGDEGIINILNSKRKVRIFVYDKDASEETGKWIEKLKGDYEILDSGMI